MKKTMALCLGSVFLGFLILTANVQGVLYNCFNAVDFGIYLQGVYGLTTGDFNPYLSVRDLKLFTDHFDPITFVPALLMKLTVLHPVVLMTFEWAVVMTLAFIVFRLARKKYDLHLSILMALLVFMNKPMLLALRFPVHPTTWSIIPLFFVSYFLFRNSAKGVFFSCLSLLLFKESYPFAIFTLSFFYLIQKRFKYFILLFFTSILSWYLLFKVRPLLLGETYSHAGLLFQEMKEGLLNFAILKVKNFRYFDLIKNFLPFWTLLGSYLVLTRKELKLSHPIVGLALFVAPLFAMQFLANRFDFHYGSTFVALLLPLFLENTTVNFLVGKKKLIWGLGILFLFNAGSEIEKMSAQVFFSKNRQCVISEEKKVSVQKLLVQTGLITSLDEVVMTGGVFNRVVRPGLKMYQIGGFSKIPESFNILLLEIHPHEQSWPLSPEDIQRFLKQCSPQTTYVMHFDDFFYLARGQFERECLQ